MNKDDYAMLKARQEIVKAFMDKLDKTSMGEASIIPALMDYVQTGDRKLFDDYRMYLEATTIEERIKRAEEANRRSEFIKGKGYPSMLALISAGKDVYDRVMSEYKQAQGF